MPPVVVTVTSTVPVPAGAVTLTEVAVLAVSPVASAAPKFTAVAPLRFDPVMVTTVPLPTGPAAGDSWATVGTGV